MELTNALLEDYQKHKSNTLYQSVMDIIIRTNKNQFNKEVSNVCEALRELTREWYADEIEEVAEKTKQKINLLNVKLSELGRTDDIIKAVSDSEYQQQLFEELGL